MELVTAYSGGSSRVSVALLGAEKSRLGRVSCEPRLPVIVISTTLPSAASLEASMMNGALGLATAATH